MHLSVLWEDPVSFKLLVSAGLGALIGLERDFAGKDPSLRTFALICLGSCVFSQMSVYAAADMPNVDPTRIAAQIVPGIGFLGAGAIFRSARGVSGITTATLMWITAAIGMAVGFNHIDLAVTGTLTAIFAIYSLKIVHIVIFKIRSTRRLKRTHKEES